MTTTSLFDLTMVVRIGGTPELAISDFGTICPDSTAKNWLNTIHMYKRQLQLEFGYKPIS